MQPDPGEPPDAQGSIPHSCLSRPNSRSTAPRWWYRPFHRPVPLGMSVCSRDAFTQTDAGTHSSVGQRHLDAPRFASAPANAQVPWSHEGGLCFPALTRGSSAAG